MVILQCDFEKYEPERLELIADQIRQYFDERVLVIPTDMNFISNLTTEQIEALKNIFEQELKERENDL